MKSGILKQFIPYLAVIIAMLIWAGAGIAVKEALLVFTPMTLIVLRFSIAVVLMFVIGMLFKRNNLLGLNRLKVKDLPYFLLGGLLQPFLYFIFETYTYKSFDSPTIAEAMLSTQPILAPIFAWIILREQITRNNILGILVSTIGMLILLLVGTDTFSLGNPLGIVLSFITVSTSVGYTIVLRKIPSYYSPLSIVFYVQTFSLFLFYLAWGFNACINDETFFAIDILSIATTQFSHAILSVAYLSVLASVVAFVLFCFTVRKIGVARANVFNNIRPVFTALIMLTLFGEQLPFSKCIGILCIILGLFISQKSQNNVNAVEKNVKI